MSDDPVPAYFSGRYIAWFIWSNMIEALSTLEAILAVITTDETMLSHAQAHRALIANAILTVILARVRRNNPAGPAPIKSPISE